MKSNTIDRIQFKEPKIIPDSIWLKQSNKFKCAEKQKGKGPPLPLMIFFNALGNKKYHPYHIIKEKENHEKLGKTLGFHLQTENGGYVREPTQPQ